MTAGPVRDRDHGAKVRQGQERARARGVRIGRPPNPKLTPDLLERARVMRAAGVRIRQTAAALHVPRSTLHHAMRVVKKSPDV
jgi:DNA invertase Pin-like site-specific DNA recombinase